MSFLKTALEKKIKELHTSIEAQKTELAAYEQVLALETGEPAGIAAVQAALRLPASTAKVAHKAPAPKPAVAKKPAAVKKPVAAKKAAVAPAPASVAPSGGSLVEVPFNGSRSDFVASLLRHRGASGITPQEITAQFKTRKIEISKNLVYNALSLMFQQKKVRKSDGRYYLLGGAAKPAAPAAAKPAASTPAKTAAKKSRISPEGMRRIVEANKARWAALKKKKK